MAYAELHAHSNFSFLDGASHPEELAAGAAHLGLSALALTDHNGLYGVVRFAEAARVLGLPTVFGAELTITGAGLPHVRTGVPDPDGTHLVVLARDPEGYARLSRVIAEAHLAGGEKGKPVITLDDLADRHGVADDAIGPRHHWLDGCEIDVPPLGVVRVGIGVLRFERRGIAFPDVVQKHVVRLEDGELGIQLRAHRREGTPRVHAERGKPRAAEFDVVIGVIAKNLC